MEITFDRKSVNACLQQRFTLPTYQREYRWEVKHLQELLEDIQESFLNNYEPTHGRAQVGDYSPYFLGTIITTAASNGARSIIDGQQRLTTLTLLMVYLLRLAKEHPEWAMSDVEPLIRRRVFGDSLFNLEFDSDRKALIETLLDNPNIKGDDLDEHVDGIINISSGTRHAYIVYSNIDNFILDQVKDGLMDRLLDYIIERVYLFEIGVPSEQDGHKVFVTMNDRGLRLAPLDLLKGYLLSNISEPKANVLANHKWAECIKNLRSLGKDEDSAFLKTWLRAQYANSTRGKSRGDSPADFEMIGDAYHRWVVDNTDRLAIVNSDDFYDLVERRIPFYVTQYKRLKEAESVFSTEFPHVFYNGAKNISLQYMVILSCLDVDDTSAVIDKKIRLVSFYIDAFITSRAVSRRGNNYDNIKDPLFSLTRKLRRQSINGILDVLRPLMSEVSSNLDEVSGVHYWRHKRQDVLHFLSRIASFLEDGMDLTNKVGFSDYVSRARGVRTFDVEHAAPTTAGVSLGVDENGMEHVTDTDSYFIRNGLGSLLLLQRGRNRSMQNMSYPDKRERYATEGVLASSLTDGFYLNNPAVQKFIADKNLSLQSEPALSPQAIDRRMEVYKEIASLIWSANCLDEIAA